MKSISIAILAALAATAAACRSVPPGTPLTPTMGPVLDDIVDVRMTERIPFETLIDRIREDRVVYIGEAHNNDHHHAFQFEVVRALYAEDPHLMIGMEMFQRPYQEAIDRFLRGETTEAEFLRETEYFTRWQWDWRYYRPIVLFAKAHGLPVVALNSPKEANQHVSRGGGLAGLTPEDRKWVAKDIDLTIQAHRDFVMRIFENHPMGPGFNKDAFYASQCVWEDTMAESVAMALERRPDYRMVVIVGGGHVQQRFGIPVRAERRGATPYSILLGMTTGDGEAPTYSKIFEEDLADYLFFTEPAPETPPSPRLGFKSKREMPGKPAAGIVVESVDEGSTADRAGLQPGDKLLRLNDTPVPDLAELRIALALLEDPIGVIDVLREGQVVRLPFVLESATQ